MWASMGHARRPSETDVICGAIMERVGLLPKVRRMTMNVRAITAAALLFGGILGIGTHAGAATFKWANDGDANSMDPYTRNETFLLSFTQNIYDPLVRRNR